MTECCTLLVPLAVLAVVALLGFVGCGLDLQGTGPLPSSPGYAPAVQAEPSLVGYWRLGDTRLRDPPKPLGDAKDEVGAPAGPHTGAYLSFPTQKQTTLAQVQLDAVAHPKPSAWAPGPFSLRQRCAAGGGTYECTTAGSSTTAPSGASTAPDSIAPGGGAKFRFVGAGDVPNPIVVSRVGSAATTSGALVDIKQLYPPSEALWRPTPRLRPSEELWPTSWPTESRTGSRKGSRPPIRSSTWSPASISAS